MDILDALSTAADKAVDGLSAFYKKATMGAQPIVDRLMQQPKPYTYRQYLSDLEREIGAPKNMLIGLVMAESRGYQGGDSFPVSNKGGVGIAQHTKIFQDQMQKMGMGDYNPNDPIQAIARTATYLKRDFNRFKDWGMTLAAYNAGRQRMLNSGSVANAPTETRNYVEYINHVIRTGAAPRGKEPSKALNELLDSPVQALMERKWK